jgi:hypothetical protein
MNDLAKRIAEVLGHSCGNDCDRCAHTECLPDGWGDCDNDLCNKCRIRNRYSEWHPDAALVGELLDLIPAKEN